MSEEQNLDLVADVRRLLGSGAVLLPLRVEGWHISLTGGGWFIKNDFDHAFMVVDFVPAEKESGRPAIDGNAPARAIVALLNAVPALCDEVERLRNQWNTRFNTLCGNCGKRYLGPRDEHLHGFDICNEPLQSTTLSRG